MNYWLGFATGAAVVTVIFYIWYRAASEVIDQATLEKE